jgi:hypothetical protein
MAGINKLGISDLQATQIMTVLFLGDRAGLGPKINNIAQSVLGAPELPHFDPVTTTLVDEKQNFISKVTLHVPALIVNTEVDYDLDPTQIIGNLIKDKTDRHNAAEEKGAALERELFGDSLMVPTEAESLQMRLSALSLQQS